MVFVIIPSPDDVGVQSLSIARRICRLAHTMSLTPIYPPLYYGMFVTPEEWGKGRADLSFRWLRRSDRIWLKFPDDDAEDLDRFTYRVLDENERLRTRRPVYQLHSASQQGVDDTLVPRAMSRNEIQDLLICNTRVGVAGACM